MPKKIDYTRMRIKGMLKEGNKDFHDMNLALSDLSNMNLEGADFRNANLNETNLSNCNLSNAKFTNAFGVETIFNESVLTNSIFLHARFQYANCRYCNFSYSNLSYGYFHGTDFFRSNLSNTILSKSDLTACIFHSANLSKADVFWSNLRYANLTDANLKNANLKYSIILDTILEDADLTDATMPFIPFVCPQKGSFLGYKVAGDKIVVLEIPDDAKRLSGTDRQCRTNKAYVKALLNLDETPSDSTQIGSNYDTSFVYKVGTMVEVKDFDDDRFHSCTTGIHFFINIDEVLEYIGYHKWATLV